MTFSKSNTAETHLCDLLVGAAAARQALFSTDLARMGGRIAGFGSHYVAPANSSSSGVQFGSMTSPGRQM